MSITNPKVIDIWAIPKSEPDSLLLIMVDPLEWGDEAAHSEHLLLLQEKINTYITFIESEEIYSEIPDARGKHLIVRVLGLHQLPEQVDWFFKRITEILNERGIGFDFELKVNEEAPSLQLVLCPALMPSYELEIGMRVGGKHENALQILKLLLLDSINEDFFLK